MKAFMFIEDDIHTWESKQYILTQNEWEMSALTWAHTPKKCFHQSPYS